MGCSRGGGELRTPMKNHKNIGFLKKTGQDPLKNHKATKPAFNVGPSSARQRNAILMALSLRADDCPLDPVSSTVTLKKKQKKKNEKKTKNKHYQIWTPSDKTFWIHAWHRQTVHHRMQLILSARVSTLARI